MQKTVIVSGMHSGDNPSPGLGVCRSLRTGLDVTLIGLDYSPSSSGLHSSVIDRAVILPSWKEMNSRLWFDQICELIRENNAVFIPCLDGEARVLAQFFGSDNDAFMCPSAQALEWAKKPAIEAAKLLGMRHPESISAEAPAREIDHFVAQSPSGVWVKGQHYEAYRAFTTSDAMRLVEHVVSLWGRPCHIERHMEGRETAICFAAHYGRLLGSVYMEKSHLTGQGKTWAGTLSAVDSSIETKLRRWVEITGWHGAAEIELVEDWDGLQSLLEINPRFPAWIWGATIHGYNLCSALVTTSYIRWKSAQKSFTRTVDEIAVRPDIGLVSYPWSPQGSNNATKHPSGMPYISSRALIARPLTHLGHKPIPPLRASESASFYAEVETPQLLLTPTAFESRTLELRSAVKVPNFVPAYSVKTNPDACLTSIAAANGFLIEVISAEEVAFARSIVNSPADIIFNGPLKWHPDIQAPHGTITFIDSLFEFDRLAEATKQNPSFTVAGLGLRLSHGESSRFGINLESDDFAAAIKMLASWCEALDTPWGIHFHHAQSALGMSRWIESASHVLDAAATVMNVIKQYPAIIDFGGGWDPRCEAANMASAVNQVFHSRRSLFGRDTRTVLELGKWLLEPCGVLYTTVVGHRSGRSDVIVDAGIPDAPETRYWPHRIEVVRASGSSPIERGTGRILGRTCMETDIIATHLDLSDVRVGDRLAILDVGAYDYSMRYRFARGAEK